MSADRINGDDPEVLSEQAVRRLLTRASELQAARSTQLSIAELREIAQEVGITPTAFDQALDEFRNRSVAPDTLARSVPARSGWLKVAVIGALAAVGGLVALFTMLRLLLP